uniref:Uncharacterized protein n=1 Tax=Setaria italica TaxID=4555 RepID=K4AKE3_SETIT
MNETGLSSAKVKIRYTYALFFLPPQEASNSPDLVHLHHRDVDPLLLPLAPLGKQATNEFFSFSGTTAISESATRPPLLSPQQLALRSLRPLPLAARLQKVRRLRRQHLGPQVRLALLPVGDGAVLVMDMILRMPWPRDSFCFFEALRRLPDGDPGVWSAAPLPEPPIGYGPLFVTAYLALAARAWISVSRRGTFSLDVERGAWWMEGSWELPLLGRAFHVPELGCVIGLSTVGGSCLCACDMEGQPRPALVRLWSETFPSGECRKAGHRLLWDMTSLAYLGEGRFRISRHVVMERNPEGRAARRLPGGELQLAKCGRLRHLGVWPYEDYPFPYFIQH